MNKTFKILMCSRPGGDRGPGLTFSHHVDALNQDKLGRFEVDELWELETYDNLDSYDVFWFYAKGFHPQLYEKLKEFKNSKIVIGPNVLLDYPDIGPADPWDNWFVENVEFDLYIDQVEFYNNHVKKFLRKDLVHKADYLDKCVVFDIDPSIIENKQPEFDCLVYSKKRRYDDNYDSFYVGIIDELEKNNISYEVVRYGDYTREDYFDLLLKARCCLNLSLDECPGIATYEAMFLNTPIIGSPNNTPSIFDQNFWVHDTDKMTEKYIKRKDNAAQPYVEKVKEFLDGKLQAPLSPREYILRHAGYERYANDAYKLMIKYCGD
jgi:hypothetical protein